MRSATTRAVTLVDVIVFRNAAEAGNAALWLHELKHVEQYAQWGVDGFARRYVQDRQAVEREAYALQAAYGRARATPSRTAVGN